MFSNLNNAKVPRIYWLLIPITLLLGIFLGSIFFEDKKDNSSEEVHNHAEVQVYTCSMHPQIKQNEPGDCPICGMDLVAVSELGSSTSASGLFLTEHELKVAQVQSMVIKATDEQNQVRQLRLNAKVSPNLDESFSQLSHVGGRIDKDFIFEEGIWVNKGDILAEIYSPKWTQSLQELEVALTTKNESLVEAIQKKLLNWKVLPGDIEAIKRTGNYSQYFLLRADFSGYVLKKEFEEGQMVKAGQILFKGSSLNENWIQIYAREEHLPYLQVGQAVEFILNQQTQSSYPAEIVYIAPEIDVNTRSIELRASLKNSTLLKPEQSGYVNIQIRLNSADTEKSLFIPKSAVLWTGERSIVYLKKEDHFYPKEVVLGQELDNTWEVKKGLQIGDEIAIQGAFNLDAAAQLAGLESMMNRTKNPYEEQIIEKNVLNTLIDHYLDLKESLVLSDLSNAKQSIESVKQLLAIDEFNDASFSMIKSYAKELGFAVNADLSALRVAFEPFSDEMYLFLLSRNELPKTVFFQYCPMAFNNKGAYWLSDQEEIANPYFGDQMLRCGEVTAILNP